MNRITRLRRGERGVRVHQVHHDDATAEPQRGAGHAHAALQSDIPAADERETTRRIIHHAHLLGGAV